MSWGFGEDSVGFSLFCSLVEVYSPFPQDDARSRVWLLTPNAPTGAAVFSVTHRHSSQVPRLPKPIVSASRASISLKTGRTSLCGEILGNELSRTDSRAPARRTHEVLADGRTHAIHQAPHSQMACAAQFLVLVPETRRFGEATWTNRGQCVLTARER